MSFPYVTDALNATLGTHWHLPVPTFGVIVAIAVSLATFLATRVVRSYEQLGRLPAQSHSTVWNKALVSTLAGIIGARVFDILDNADRFLADPLSMILTRTGFSIYGGLCFGVLTGVIFVKRRSIPVIPMLDATAPPHHAGIRNRSPWVPDIRRWRLGYRRQHDLEAELVTRLALDTDL